MPCYTRRNSLFTPRNVRKRQTRVAPTPVRPRDPNTHGLLGLNNVTQHLIIDDNWTPLSVAEPLVQMSALLSRRIIYNKHEKKDMTNGLRRKSDRLIDERNEGRTKLKMLLEGDNAKQIHNMLQDHKDMQRLFQNMPIEQVLDNMNQRTFALRKERDRLRFRLNQLSRKLKDIKVEHSAVENCVKYESLRILKEDILSQTLSKKLQMSNLRFRAISTINSTYQKMIQVLNDDAIFYEPILRSLELDIQDQQNMIKYIVQLGKPAIESLGKLKRRYAKLGEESRQHYQQVVSLLKELKPSRSKSVFKPKDINESFATADRERYLRRTKSMDMLKTQLDAIEKVVRELKLTTLSAQANDIYPGFKGIFNKNKNLLHQIQHNRMQNDDLKERIKYANILYDVLSNDLSEEEINRLQYIDELRVAVKTESSIEREIIEYMENRANAYVMMRISIWNMLEILRHVGRSPIHAHARSYQSSYLKLPLLFFEQHFSGAIPPLLYQEDIDKLMELLKRNLYRLMKGYTKSTPEQIKEYVNEYHDVFMSATLRDDRFASYMEDDYTDIVERIDPSILTHRQIKQMSAKIVENARNEADNN